MGRLVNNHTTKMCHCCGRLIGDGEKVWQQYRPSNVREWYCVDCEKDGGAQKCGLHGPAKRYKYDVATQG